MRLWAETGRGGGRVAGWGAVSGGRDAVRCSRGWGVSLGASYRQYLHRQAGSFVLCCLHCHSSVFSVSVGQGSLELCSPPSSASRAVQISGLWLPPRLVQSCLSELEVAG